MDIAVTGKKADKKLDVKETDSVTNRKSKVRDGMAIVIERMSRFLALVGSIGVIAMMLHITIDVILRSLFSLPIPATLEIVTRYYMMAMALFPLAWVEWRKDMISVDAFSSLFGSKLGRVIDSIVSLLSMSLYLLLGYVTLKYAVGQFDIGSYILALNTKVPVWPSYFILPISFFLAALVCLFRSFFGTRDK